MRVEHLLQKYQNRNRLSSRMTNKKKQEQMLPFGYIDYLILRHDGNLLYLFHLLYLLCLFLWTLSPSYSDDLSDSLLGFLSCASYQYMSTNEYANMLSKVLAIAYLVKYMRRYSQHSRTFPMHQKIWFLYEKDATILYLTDSHLDISEK